MLVLECGEFVLGRIGCVGLGSRNVGLSAGFVGHGLDRVLVMVGDV